MAKRLLNGTTKHLRTPAKSVSGPRPTALPCSTISRTEPNEAMRTVALLILAASYLALPAAELLPMKLVQTIPLPGVKGRFDHFSIDANGNRLFVAALGNNTLEVIDLAAGKRIESIPG